MPRTKLTTHHQIDAIGEATRQWLGAEPAEIYLLRWRSHRSQRKHQRPATHAQATAWAKRHGLTLPVAPQAPRPAAGAL